MPLPGVTPSGMIAIVSILALLTRDGVASGMKGGKGREARSIKENRNNIMGWDWDNEMEVFNSFVFMG